ncbi:MAG: transposase, partial [Thermoplasmata archaeon]
GIDFNNFTRRNMNMLKDSSPILKILVEDLEDVSRQIDQMDVQIAEKWETNHYAMLIDTIPGIGKYGSLAIASEIGDVNRFPREDNIFSYAGLVPRIYQSGSREYKGHITPGNKFLKYMLLECAHIHINREPDSPITEAYRRIKLRSGSNRAKIAAARHLLRLIYYMLKRNQTYDSYERRGRS